VGVLGGGVHLVGDSSSGKSLAQLIGSSVWGDPGVFAASWDMTKGGLEIEASSRNDTILPWMRSSAPTPSAYRKWPTPSPTARAKAP
jgi:uncharacterized protein (DUF927 family)